jgi:hypothetical protein
MAALDRRFPKVNWLAVWVEVLGGPAAAAAKSPWSARTIKGWLRRPLGDLSYHKFGPIGKAVGLSDGMLFDLIGLTIRREPEYRRLRRDEKRMAKQRAA